MFFPKEYIMKGNFRLHSGDYTDTFYDVNAMLTQRPLLNKILTEIDLNSWGVDCFVGISTAGAIIASHNFSGDFAMVKDGEVKGIVDAPYMLIDDVCTTEASLKEAIDIIGQKPETIFVVVDRRKEKTLEIKAIWHLK